MSSCESHYFLHVLTFHSKLRELNESIDGRIRLFGCILPQSATPYPPPPPPLAFPWVSVTFFLSKNVFPFIHHVVSFVVRPLVLNTLLPLPRLSVFLVISLHMYTSRTFSSFGLNMPRLSRIVTLVRRAMLDPEVALYHVTLHITNERRKRRRGELHGFTPWDGPLPSPDVAHP